MGIMEEDEASGWQRLDFSDPTITRDEEEGSRELGFGSMEGDVERN